MAVLGVDACKHGWVGIVLDDAGPLRVVCERTIRELVDAAGRVDVVGIDIPIGLPIVGERVCDREARDRLGPRRSSIFMTPPRAVLEAVDHAAATQLAVATSGKGISRQAFGLAAKILEVDELASATTPSPAPIREVHPELSFARMSGAPLRDGKTTWPGMAERRRLLEAEGIVLTGDLGLSGKRVATDDVLDAAAVAWTARRIVLGTARPLPDPPELVADGRLAAIWA